MKSLALIAMMALAGGTAHAAITVNGLPTMADTERHMLLCSVPEECFGRPFTALIASDDPSATITMDGAATSNRAVTLNDITRNNTHTVVVRSGSTSHTWQLAFTFLPVVTLSGSFNNDYQPCSITVTLPGGTTGETFTAKGKHRGGITNEDHCHKRNYHIKLVDAQGNKVNRPLLGMCNDNSWILDAGQIDLARIRNHVGMDLWRDFASQPYYFGLTPNAVGGVHSEFVELFLNGAYRGLYSLGEPIDRKQLRLKKFDEDTGEIHGLLWKGVSWDAPVTMQTVRADYNNFSDRWGGLELKYPDLDEVCPTDWATFYNAAQFVVASSDEDFCAYVADYFDLPVLGDYYLLCQLLKAIDNRGKNMYWFIHDQAADKRISVTPWDLDPTTGQYWTDWWMPDKDNHTDPSLEMPMGHRLFDRLVALNPGGAYVQTLRRYWQLRTSTFALDSLTARYIVPIERLQLAGTAQREADRWSGDEDIAYTTLDFDEQKTLIAQWLLKRLKLLDKQFQYTEINGDINGNRCVDVEDLNILVNIMLRKNQDPSLKTQADITHDGIVDVDDLSAIINIMLHKNQEKATPNPS